jgi:ABC-2 type transport system permease protein
MALAVFFLYNLWFILSTLAFYVEKLDNINDIVPSLRRAFQVPRSVYTGLASLIFTVILPIGLISSLPSEVLLGKSNSWWLIYFIGVALFTFGFARIFFKFAIKKYSGVAN